jgi:uncharacterized membrane protein YecN with MAPEG domain
MLEISQSPIWLIHLLGVVFLTGRLIHANGVSKANIKQRILGMQITLWILITLAILNFMAFAGITLPG